VGALFFELAPEERHNAEFLINTKRSLFPLFHF
jgi:hypothetical protein